MTHGKITDIYAFKKAVGKSKHPPVTITNKSYTYHRIPSGGWEEVNCSHIMHRSDVCDGNDVAVIHNADGSYYLKWETGSEETNQRILRAVQRIMELYEEELKAKDKKDKTYDEEQTDKQNELVSKQAAKKQQHVTT